MSTKLTGYVWDACASSGMKLSSVAIMARLADFSSDEGVSWPSIGTIARQIGAGESTVRTAIAQLEKDGWLSRKQRRNGNRNASNVYQLNVAKLQAAAFSHLSDSDASKPDASKSDPSKFEASKNSKTGSFDPSESGGDPSVKPTTDPSDKKTYCQVASQPDAECVNQDVLITDQAVLILSHLNKVTGKQFRKGKSSLDNIRARLRESFTRDDMLLVIDYKHEQWQDTKYYEHMQPTTLFRPTKFDGYLQNALRWDSKGRPKRQDWEGHRKSSDLMSFGTPDKAIPAGFRGAKS
ncbi:conserved phage C-terminal domain-containing protein [Lelliottia amnigena]|uniref:conserved phage C-terminal domain-containing protein n=1 Tax=Lelliottia amnigena TaxID=61646 RepID=UPI00192BF8CF|nr:conserved phage C-terminal domain-containing protein [Lelliottia amnigena]MBL5919803.1 conserved phage C-terminal domain-containing protein [Lelliottia amnigena]